MHKYPQNSPRFFEQTHAKKYANVAAYEKILSSFASKKLHRDNEQIPPKIANQGSWFLPLKVMFPVRRVIKEAENSFWSLCHGDYFGNKNPLVQGDI